MSIQSLYQMSLRGRAKRRFLFLSWWKASHVHEKEDRTLALLFHLKMAMNTQFLYHQTTRYVFGAPL